MQNMEHQKAATLTDQVVLQMDQQRLQTKLETELNDLTRPPTATEKPPNPSRTRTLRLNFSNDLTHSSTATEKPPNPSQTRTLQRLNFSKPKSRFVETNYALSSKSDELHQPFLSQENNYQSTDEDSDSDDFSEYEGEEGEDSITKYGKKKRKIRCRSWIEWISFFLIMAALICSLTLRSLKDETKWGLKIWKWCLMIMVIICGRLVSGWVVGILVFFIERNFMLREKVLYFVYGLRKSFQNCFWLGLVLLSWSIMFSPDVHKNNKMLRKVFRALIAVLLGATIWLIKILLVKILASSFHVATFFDRMKESVFHHYILESLSDEPLDDEDCQRNLTISKSLPERLSWRSKSKTSMKRVGSRRVDMEKLRKLSLESTTSALSVKRLMNYVKSSGLSTISRTIDDFGKAQSEITSEKEAKICAQRIFRNVAQPGAK